MAGDGGVERRAEAGRTGADDRDPLPGARTDRRPPRHLPGQVPVGGEPLHVVDRHRRVHQGTSALRLAGVRTDPAAGGRERVAVLDHPHRRLEVSVGHQGEVALDVDVGRAGLLARRLAVGVVVAQQLLHAHLAVGVDRRRAGVDHHPRRDRGDARLHLAPRLPDLNHAEPAVAVGPLEPHVVAERRDVEPLLLEGGEDGEAVVDLYLPAVHRDGDAGSLGKVVHGSLLIETGLTR